MSVSNEIEAQDRFIADPDRLQPGPREFVCGVCNLVAPVHSFVDGYCGECRETGRTQ